MTTPRALHTSTLSRAMRVTVDGGSIMAAGSGGAQMGFSQEVVQEFQVSTVNFDLSTGITATGAINVVTRSGTDDLHGAAFYFFRDRKLAGYPALGRDAADPDPFTSVLHPSLVNDLRFSYFYTNTSEV